MKARKYRVILARCGMPRVRITTVESRSVAYDFRKAYVNRNLGLRLSDLIVVQVRR